MNAGTPASSAPGPSSSLGMRRATAASTKAASRALPRGSRSAYLRSDVDLSRYAAHHRLVE